MSKAAKPRKTHAPDWGEISRRGSVSGSVICSEISDVRIPVQREESWIDQPTNLSDLLKEAVALGQYARSQDMLFQNEESEGINLEEYPEPAFEDIPDADPNVTDSIAAEIRAQNQMLDSSYLVLNEHSGISKANTDENIKQQVQQLRSQLSKMEDDARMRTENSMATAKQTESSYGDKMQVPNPSRISDGGELSFEELQNELDAEEVLRAYNELCLLDN